MLDWGTAVKSLHFLISLTSLIVELEYIVRDFTLEEDSLYSKLNFKVDPPIR